MIKLSLVPPVVVPGVVAAVAFTIVLVTTMSIYGFLAAWADPESLAAYLHCHTKKRWRIGNAARKQLWRWGRVVESRYWAKREIHKLSETEQFTAISQLSQIHEAWARHMLERYSEDKGLSERTRERAKGALRSFHRQRGNIGGPPDELRGRQDNRGGSVNI